MEGSQEIVQAMQLVANFGGKSVDMAFKVTGALTLASIQLLKLLANGSVFITKGTKDFKYEHSCIVSIHKLKIREGADLKYIGVDEEVAKEFEKNVKQCGGHMARMRKVTKDGKVHYAYSVKDAEKIAYAMKLTGMGHFHEENIGDIINNADPELVKEAAKEVEQERLIEMKGNPRQEINPDMDAAREKIRNSKFFSTCKCKEGVKDLYHTFAKIYHPDEHNVSIDPKAKDFINERFSQMQKEYKELVDLFPSDPTYIKMSERDPYEGMQKGEGFIFVDNNNIKMRTPDATETLVREERGKVEAMTAGKKQAQTFVKENVKAAKEVKKKEYDHVTINKDALVTDEQKDIFVTRIPGTRGMEYIAFSKKDVKEIDDGKTLLVSLDKNKDYKILDRNGDLLEIRKGKDLKKNYDDAKNRSKAYQMNKNKNKNNEKSTDKKPQPDKGKTTGPKYSETDFLYNAKKDKGRAR